MRACVLIIRMKCRLSQPDCLCDRDEALRGGQHFKEVPHNHQVLLESTQVCLPFKLVHMS